MIRIGFVGAGKIAQALAKGFIAAGKCPMTRRHNNTLIYSLVI
jgi:pyrroline-5-carboxylate reductase